MFKLTNLRDSEMTLLTFVGVQKLLYRHTCSRDLEGTGYYYVFTLRPWYKTAF